jgi:hypothetical protein
LDLIRDLEQKLAVEDYEGVLACLHRIFPAFKSRPPEFASSPDEELQHSLSVVEGAHA